MRGRHLHRRPRAGRGAGAGAAQGRGAGGEGNLHRGRARGVRPRFRFPDVPRQRPLRRRVPAGDLHRPPSHRQAPRGDCAADRRRRRRPRRHRQGQRPGALRARRVCAQPGHQDHRTVARVGPPLPRAASDVCRGARHPHRTQEQQRIALLDGRQPAAHLVRRQRARSSRDRAGRRDVAVDPLAGGRARHSALCRADLPARGTWSRSTGRR